MNREPNAVAQNAPKWPEIQPGWRSRLNRWVLSYPRLQFRLGDRDLVLTWIAPRVIQLPLAIHLRCAGHDFRMRISGLDVVDPRLVGEPFAGMPRSLKTLVVERVIAELAVILPADIANTLDVIGISWHGEEMGGERGRNGISGVPEVAFELHNRSLHSFSSGCFEFSDPGAMDWIMERFSRVPGRNIDGVDLRVRASLTLGSSTVAMEDIRKLESGGFVWICTGNIHAKGISARMVLDGDPTEYSLLVKQRRVTVLEPGNIAGVRLEEGESPSASNIKDHAMNPDTSKLQLKLQFDLGEVMLSVGEIERLGPGYVFELPQEVADTEVLIKVHGQCIAIGEIMAVGRRLGVRITRLVAA